MRHYACVTSRTVRTANYSEDARARLGLAVAKAREAAGHKYRTTFARAAEIKSIRSLEMLEAGSPGVGQSILFAVGRALPNWNEDTPRVILEGGPIPSTQVTDRLYERVLRDETEEALMDITELPEDNRWAKIFQRRKKLDEEQGSQGSPMGRSA